MAYSRMSDVDLDTQLGAEQAQGKKSVKPGLEPGKVAGTDNYGEGGPGVAPPVPGKRSAADLLLGDSDPQLEGMETEEAGASDVSGAHAGAAGVTGYARGAGGGPGAQTARQSRGGTGHGETPRPGPADITIEPVHNPDAGRESDTTVGVGEPVVLRSTRSGSWRASAVGPGGRRTGRGRQFRWIAPATPGPVTVTFSAGAGQADQAIAFTVVAPQSVHFYNSGEERFPAGEAGVGLTARVRFAPFSVSFGAIEWKEEPSGPDLIRGYFRSHTPPSHGRREGAGRWIRNRAGLPDMAVFGGFPAPWTSGSFTWVIPNRYRVAGAGGDGQEFTTVHQTCTLDGPPHAGRLTVTKGDVRGGAVARAQREPGAARGGRGGSRARGAAGVEGVGIGEAGAPRRGYGLGLGGDEADAHATELAALRGHVPARWMPVIELVPADGGALAPEVERRLKQGAYQRLIDRVAGYEAVQAYLNSDACFAAHRRALEQVNLEVVGDLTPIQQVREAVARLATGMVERDVHTAVLAGYSRVSPTGRRYLRELELVTQLAEGPVRQLLRGDSALVPLPEEPAAAAAADGAAAPAAEEPALDEQFASIKERLLREDPAEDTPAARTRRDALVTDLRAADGRVLDRLQADAEASMRIAALTRLAIPGDSGAGYTLDVAYAADSVSQLHRSLLDLDGEDAKFNAIKAYLEQRPGPDNQPARARVMQNQPLMSVITGFTGTHQRMISRLIATGSSERTPMVILQDAGLGQVAASGALHAAIALSRTPGFQELRSDGMFRQTIESGSNRTVTTVDGITTCAHDLILRMWGIVPSGAGDAESALPTDAVNPTGEGPPDPGELEQINALFPPTINALARELGSVFYVSDANMVSILTDFEASCAAPDKRPIFERARMHPGIELTRRCTTDSRIGDLRNQIHRHVDGEQERQTCERVLGIRVDSATVGRIDGGVVLPDDERALSSGTVPLAQALRSTQVSPSHDWASGEMSLSQLVHQAAIAIKDKLNEWHLWGGCAGSDITSIYRQLTSTFGGRAVASPRADGASGDAAVARTVRQELERQTGIAQIHPIELLVNAFQTVPGGGDLASRINERVEEGERASTLLALHLDAAAVRERTRAAEPPPAGRFEARAQELHTALQAAQRAERNEEEDADQVDADAVRQAGQVWSQVRSLDAAAGPSAPAAPGAPAAAAPAPGSETFAGTYRRLFGIDPERHVVEVGRAASSLRGTTSLQRSEIATWLHLDPARLTAAVTVTEDTEALPAATASGFTRDQAVDAARRIWEGVCAGDVVPVRAQLEGRRPDERALIERAFRRLSGDIDLQFYVQQAHEHASGGSRDRMFLVGMEGVHGEGAAAGPSRASPYDASSWTEALDVVATGSVGVLTRIRTALASSNRNEIFRIADEATREDRVAILGDGATMQRLRTVLEGVDYDRVYAVLTGTADLATRLYSRSEGDVSGPVSRFFSDTDTEGMRRDIREYGARRREFHLRRAEEEGRDPRSPATEGRVQAAVREDLLRAYDNPQVRAVIDQEFPSWSMSSSTLHAVDSEGAELEGMLLGGGEADGLADLRTDGYASSGDILAQVRQMSVEQRQRYRTDPEMLRRVWDRSINLQNRRLILLALQSDEPAGEDHILRLVELGSTGDTTEAREQIARLSERELRRLRGQPGLVAEISQHLRPAEQTRFRALITLDTEGAARLIGATVAPAPVDGDAAGTTAAPGTAPDAATAPTDTLYQLGDAAHPVPGRVDAHEVERLGTLRARCVQRLLLGANNSWIRLLREAVEVFRADLRPRLQPVAPAADATGAPPDLAAAARTYERHLREQLWAEIEGDAALLAAARDNGSDLAADSAVGAIHAAVLKDRDPSSLILVEDLHWYGNEHEDMEATIRQASPELVINEWSSVKLPKYPGTGGESLLVVYEQFRGARDAATAAPGATPPEGAVAAAHRWQQAFQRYVVEPSSAFERMLLPHSGGMLADRAETTRADQELDRDNPTYARYRRALNERIRTLDNALVAEAIGATGADAEMLGSRLRGALTDFEVAEEIYAHHRGDGQGAFAQDEGRELDRSFGDYRREVARAEDTAATEGDIDDRERRRLGHLDEGLRDRAGDYQAAREQAASIAATIVGTITAVIVTALTAGAATPLTMMMYGALTSAAAASGEVLTREMVLGRTYDASGDGVREVAAAAASGFVAAGAQYYAGRLTSGLLANAASQAEQGRLISEMATHAPSRWQTMLAAGGRTLVQQTITGLVETTGSMLSPSVWSHGWDEGWIRASQRGREELRSRPLAALRATIVAMIGASVGSEGPTGEAVRPGERVGLDRTLRQIGSDMPSTLVSTAADVGIGVASGELRSVEAAAGHFGSGVAGSVRDVGTGIHEGSVHRAEATRFAEAQLADFPHLFQTDHEQMLYRAAVENSLAHGDPPTAVEFATARAALAASIARATPEFAAMTPAEQEQFIAWVRAAPSTAEFRVRMHQSPRLALGDVVGHAPEASRPQLDIVTEARDALREIHERSFATEVTAGPMDGHERVGEARVDSREATRLEERARAAVAELRTQVTRAELRGAPNLEALRADLRLAEEAFREVANQATLIRLSASAAIGNATDAGHVTSITTLEPGAPPPADVTPAQRDAILAANRIYEQLSNPRDARFLGPDSARVAWAEYLQRHGVDVPGFVATDTAHDLSGATGGAVREAEGHPLERGRASVGDDITPHAESAIASEGEPGARSVARGFHDESRAAMLAGVAPEVAYASLAELVGAGAIPGVRESSGGRAVEVTIGEGATARRLRIEVLRPADTHGAVAQSDFGADPDHVHVWVSDRIRDDQVTRALGGIIHDVIARASGRSGDAAGTAGRQGQLRALFAHLETLSAAAPIPTDGDPHHVAMAVGRSETVGRVRAELDLLLLDMHLVGGPEARRTAALEAITDPTLRRLVDAHLRGPGAIRIDAAAAADGAARTRTAPEATATDAAVAGGHASASSVLPPPPTGEIRAFSADDYPRVLELRLHFEAIRELDQRLAARDRAGSARGEDSPARGESLRRREHVARAQALLAELQIGGTNPEFIRQRLAELEAVFPGSSDISTGVRDRVERRVAAVDAHQRAEAYRRARAERAAELARILQASASGTPFTTDRIIVGGGMAGTSRAAALGVAVGEAGTVDPHALLMLGGDDMISRWDPDEHWGQRPGVFENSDHPMYRGSTEGNHLGDVVEDPGEFMHVGELNDSMDLARQRLGLVPVDARVTQVQVAEPGRPWPGVGPEFVVKVTVTVGGAEVIVYARHTDITTGLGNTGMPNEGVLDAATRRDLLTAEPGGVPIVMGGERLMARDAPPMTGRVLVVAFGPTGAWAAARAVELGASGVDWAGTASSDMNLLSMRRAATIDRTQESFGGDVAARVHRTTDQIIRIEHDGGGGAVVTYAYPGDPPRTYRVRYDHVLMTQGFDSAGGTGAGRDAPSAPGPTGDGRVGTMIGGLEMRAMEGTDAPNLENTGPNAGAVSVFGGAAWDSAGVTSDRERAVLADRRRAAGGGLSSDSPDARTMEAMGHAVDVP